MKHYFIVYKLRGKGNKHRFGNQAVLGVNSGSMHSKLLENVLYLFLRLQNKYNSIFLVRLLQGMYIMNIKQLAPKRFCFLLISII